MASKSESRRFAFGNIPDAVDLVITWVESLHGRGDAVDALRLILKQVNGKRASLLRLHLDTARESVLETVETMAGDLPSRRSGISFPQYLLGFGLGQARAGSVWYVSEFAREIADDESVVPHLGIPDARSRETAAIVLEPRPLTSDILELDLPERPSAPDTEALSLLASVLSRGWRHRADELFPATTGYRPVLEQRFGQPRSEAILSATNPAGLSRSEYRVCELVRRGMSAKAISGRLLISESTVRSHLRSIYSKTKARGQRELICKLLASDGPAGRPLGWAAEPAEAQGPAAARRRSIPDAR